MKEHVERRTVRPFSVPWIKQEFRSPNLAQVLPDGCYEWPSRSAHRAGGFTPEVAARSSVQRRKLRPWVSDYFCAGQRASFAAGGDFWEACFRFAVRFVESRAIQCVLINLANELNDE